MDATAEGARVTAQQMWHRCVADALTICQTVIEIAELERRSAPFEASAEAFQEMVLQRQGIVDRWDAIDCTDTDEGADADPFTQVTRVRGRDTSDDDSDADEDDDVTSAALSLPDTFPIGTYAQPNAYFYFYKKIGGPNPLASCAPRRRVRTADVAGYGCPFSPSADCCGGS